MILLLWNETGFKTEIEIEDEMYERLEVLAEENNMTFEAYFCYCIGKALKERNKRD